MNKNSVLTAALVLASAACTDAGAAAMRSPTGSDTVALAVRSDTAARHASWRVDLKQARQELLQADRALSAATQADGFVNGLVAGMTDDARFLFSGPDVLRGRDAIRAYIAGGPLGRARMRWEPLRADVSADGRMGYTFGGGAYTRADGTTAFTRYITVWKRDAQGPWKVAATVLNLTGTEAAAAPAGFGTREDNGVRGAHPTDPAVSLAEAMQADRDFAALSVSAGPRVAFMAFASETGVLVSGPEYGPEQIGNGFPKDPKEAQLLWGPIDGEAAGSGDLAYTIGHAVTVIPQANAPEIRRYSKYLSVWRRQPNGQWKYEADGGNTRPAS